MGVEKDRLTESLQKCLKKSQWDKAIQVLDRLSLLEPNQAVHRLRAGDYYLKMGATEKTVAAYDQAAGLFTKGGFIVKALTAYKMILRLDPQNESVHAKMQGLHTQVREQAALSQPYIITADTPLPEKAAPVSVPGMEWSYETATTPPESEPAVPSAPFEVEQTSYGQSGGDSISEPAPAGATPQERRLTDVIPLFSSLTPEEFAEVVEHMTHFRYPAGYRIVKEGDTGNSVYLISEGTVQVVTKFGKREVFLSELKDNDFFGEVSFLTGDPRTASVIAKTDTEILELRGEDLTRIIQQYPRVREVLEDFYKARIKDTLSKVKHAGL